MLPGTRHGITPIIEAYIYARAAGYLKQLLCPDIGDQPCQAGQRLADIEMAPDLDQQVSQARAALAQAEGQLGCGQLSAPRSINSLQHAIWRRSRGRDTRC